MGGWTLSRDKRQGEQRSGKRRKKQSKIPVLSSSFVTNPGWNVHLPERSKVASKTNGVTTLTRAYLSGMVKCFEGTGTSIADGFVSLLRAEHVTWECPNASVKWDRVTARERSADQKAGVYDVPRRYARPIVQH